MRRHAHPKWRDDLRLVGECALLLKYIWDVEQWHYVPVTAYYFATFANLGAYTPRVVRLNDLDAAQRRLVLALIDAHKSNCRIAEGCPTCHGVPMKKEAS
jgi:hypothetical protein